MKITVDANVVMAVLIKDGFTRRLFFNAELVKFAPVFLLVELSKYRELSFKKFQGTAEDFNELFDLVIASINFVSDEDLIPFLPAAASLISDDKDWLYLACALKEDTVILSNDKGFKTQGRVIVKNISELAKDVGLL